jgi:hypothetical protein
MIKQLLKHCLSFLFLKKKELPSNEIVKSLRKIKDIQIYDDVYIQIDNQIYTACVMQKNINSIIIGYTIGEDFKEYTFNIRGM